MDDTILDDFSEISDSSDNDFVVKVQLLEPEKFLILMILTMGLYGFWWMYKSWQFFQKKDGLDVIPWARALFSVFYMYRLIEMIKQQAKKLKYFDDYSSVLLVLLFFGSTILLLLPSLLSLAFIVGVMAMIKPHEAFNHLAERSDRVRAIYQEKYSSRQILLVLFGIMLWTVALIRGFISFVLLS